MFTKINAEILKHARSEIAYWEQITTDICREEIAKCSTIEEHEALFRELPDCVDRVFLADKIRQMKKMVDNKSDI